MSCQLLPRGSGAGELELKNDAWKIGRRSVSFQGPVTLSEAIVKFRGSSTIRRKRCQRYIRTPKHLPFQESVMKEAQRKAFSLPKPKTKNNSPFLPFLSSMRNSKHRTPPLKIHRSNVSASGREDKTRAIQMVCRHL